MVSRDSVGGGPLRGQCVYGSVFIGGGCRLGVESQQAAALCEVHPSWFGLW